MVSVFGIIGGFGLDLLYLECKKRYGKVILSAFIAVTMILSGIVVFFAVIIYVFSTNKEMFFICFLTGVYILFQNISMYACVENIKKRNCIILLIQLGYLSFLFLLYNLRYRNVWCYLLLYAIEMIITVGTILKVYNFHPSLDYFRQHNSFLGFMIFHGVKGMIITLLISFNYNIDIIMLKMANINLDLIGIYSAAVTLSSAILLIPDSLKEIVLGKSTKSADTKFVKKYLYINWGIMTVVFMTFAFLGEFFITIFYGIEYSQAYQLTLILFLGDIFMCFYKIIHPIIIADGNQNIVIFFLTISVVVNIVCNICTIPRFNVFGAACSSVMSYALTGILFLIYYLRHYRKEDS